MTRRRAPAKKAVVRAQAPAPAPPPRKVVRPAWASERRNTAASSYQKLSSFVDDVLGGAYRLPVFQRPWRWSDADVLQLLATLFAGGYVGTLLIWDRCDMAPSVERFGEVEIASNERRVGLVIDGQQRIGAIMTAAHSGRFFFNLRTGTFCVAAPGPWLCPVDRMMGLSALRTADRWWYDEHAAEFSLSADDVRGAWGCAISMMENAHIHMCVLNERWSLHDVVDTYRRLNTTGVKMSPEDLEAGLMRAGAV